MPRKTTRRAFTSVRPKHLSKFKCKVISFFRLHSPLASEAQVVTLLHLLKDRLKQVRFPM